MRYANGPLAHNIELYVAHKRSLGKQLAKAEPMLLLLDRCLLAQGVTELRQITPAHLEGFMASRPRHSPRSYNVLIGTLRGLFDWLVVQEVLPESPLRCASRRVTPSRRPFLFNPPQASRLLEVAGQLPSNPRAQARGEIYKMIFALLYGLGLRVGEVSRLCRQDVDLDNQTLIIRQTKFGKDRLVPFGPRMADALATFLEREESRCGIIPPDGPVFSFARQERAPISPNTISQTFHKLLPALQLTVPLGVAPPHLHCLRHSFAVGTLLRWYRAGIDPMSPLGPFHVSRPRQPFLNGRLPDHHHRVTGMRQSTLRTFCDEQPEGVCPMNAINVPTLGAVLSSFFNDYLKLQKGLRPNSIRSYADAMRLFLQFAAKTMERKITQLGLDDLDADLVSTFLNSLGESRGNAAQSRNLRLAALRTFFEYLGQRFPDRLGLAQKVAAIPRKCAQPPETIFLERDEIEGTLAALPAQGQHALRDRTLLLFLYNTGSRVQEAADVRANNLRFDPSPCVHLH